jgi:hypothetical protein
MSNLSSLGHELKTFLVSYNYEGAKWNLELKARDMADARARMGRLTYANLDGELMAKIPVPRGRLGIGLGRLLGAVQGFVLPPRG